MINDNPQSKLNQQARIGFQQDPQNTLDTNGRTGQLNSTTSSSQSDINREQSGRPIDQQPGNPEKGLADAMVPDNPDDGFIARTAKKAARWYLNRKQDEYMGTKRSDEKLEDSPISSDAVPPVERKGAIPTDGPPVPKVPGGTIPQAPRPPRYVAKKPPVLPKPKSPGKPRF